MSTALLYVAAIVGIVVAELAALVALRIGRVEIDQTLLAQLLGIGTPTLVALLALLRGIGNSQEIKQAATNVERKVELGHEILRGEVRHNTELTEQTKQAVESGT